MKNYLTTLFCLFTAFVSAQDFIDATKLTSYNKVIFQAQLGLLVQNDVDIYKMRYTTKDLSGQVDTASGLVVLPTDHGYEYSVVAYHHGTVGSRDDVPSRLNGESIIPAVYGAYGFIALAPDYLGLGDSKGFHPYIHAASEAWATKDMIFAAETFYEEQEIKYKKRLFTCGYSQGGHAGMATHRLFETNDLGYEVIAAAHMSGPYDISNTMRPLLLSEEEYELVAYLPFVALAYDEVYGIFDGDINNFFKPSYSKEILKFYNEEIDLWELNTILLDKLQVNIGKFTPKHMIQEDMLEAILNDDNHPVNVALKDNDVYDWAPKASTRLYYCDMDEQVSFQNSITAEDKMTLNGSTDVKAISLDSLGDHGTCVQPAIVSSIFHFLPFRDLTTNISTIDGFEANQIFVYPNPSISDFITINGLNIHEHYTITLFDSNGSIRKTLTDYKMGTTIDIQDLHSGLYIIQANDIKGKVSTQRIVIR